MRFQNHPWLFVLQKKAPVFPAPATVHRFHDANSAYSSGSDPLGETQRPVLVNISFSGSRVPGQCFRIVFIVINSIERPAAFVGHILIHRFKPDRPMESGAIGRHGRCYVRSGRIAESLVGIFSTGKFQIAGVTPDGILAIFARENPESITYPGSSHIAVHKIIESERISLYEPEGGYFEIG